MRKYFATVLLLAVGGVAHAGYDVHISRKANWVDDKGPRIERSEFLQYMRTDPDIRRDLENTEDDFLVSIRGQTFPLWFNPRMGELYTKDPSPAAIEKLKQIAKALNARVQGDEGENF